MSSLKSHITLILALISILFSIFLFRVFSQLLFKYKQNIIENYSIVIVSQKPLKNSDINNLGTLKTIPIKNEVNKLKQKYPNIDFSNINLPFFYKLNLKSLPSPKELNKIKDNLLSKPFIKKIMTKSSSQTKIYNLLMLLEIVTKTFMILIGILGFLLIIKQLEVWKLLHNERMYIMELFGAPFWFRGAALFKIAFLDSIISLIITIFLIYFVINSALFTKIIQDLNIEFEINYLKEISLLFIISILISLISSILVVIGKK